VPGQATFDSYSDAVVAMAAALVNVATPGRRHGRPYAVPTGSALVAGVADALHVGGPAMYAPPPAARAMPAFTQLAAGLRPVFEALEDGRPDQAARLVNGLLGRYQPAPRLEADGARWHLHFHGGTGADPSGWGGGMAVGLATAVASGSADRLGVCAAAACDRVFVDASRNGTRRFCSTACQNRTKTASHRARQRA
jgi:CGNR zinc finger protein